MFEKLLSLTLATTLLLANGLVGMEPPEQAKANLWVTLQRSCSHPLHEIAAKAGNDCTWPIEVDGETVRVPVEEFVTKLLNQEKDINELLPADENHNHLRTPLDIAEEQGNNKLATFLEENGARNTTIELYGRTDDLSKEVTDPLLVKAWLARWCGFFNNQSIFTFKEGSRENPCDPLVLGVVNFEEIAHTTIVQSFTFLEGLTKNPKDAIETLKSLNQDDQEKLAFVMDFLLLDKEKTASFVNQLDINNKTMLDLTTTTNEAGQNLLPLLGGKKTYYVTGNSFVEIISTLEQNIEEAQKKLVVINLAKKNIRSISEEETEKLAKFQVASIDLSSNSLSQESLSIISNMGNLQTLRLFYNHLTSLPDNFGRDMTSLKELRLSCNYLTSLPKDFGQGMHNLTSLDLRSNELTNLPTEIGNLKKLTSLNLSSNKLSQEALKIIATIPNLTSLDLERNELTNLPTEIRNLEKLTSLNLSSNELRWAILKIIATTPNLTSLDLSSNGLTNLPTKIGNLENLTSLDLSLNELTNLPT
ncbi:leucine-rich repeat domain-containing protein, partial [Candidatus Babeliales bacterium]|nr:leucine-rich repeat domain-containing protein [Candidatus Babeliales bacterium]